MKDLSGFRGRATGRVQKARSAEACEALRFAQGDKSFMRRQFLLSGAAPQWAAHDGVASDRLVASMAVSFVVSRALALHKSAVDELVGRAENVTEEAWREPIGDGKWSPGEVVAHLVCTYDTLLRELGGAPGMAIRTSFFQRCLLRLTILPRILAFGVFPKGAVAPRETRPEAGLGREEGVALFRRRAEELERAALAARPEQKLTHAYFGTARVAHGVLLCARHIQHHAAQLGRREEVVVGEPVERRARTVKR